MEECGYVPVRNGDAKDGLWKSVVADRPSTAERSQRARRSRRRRRRTSYRRRQSVKSVKSVIRHCLTSAPTTG